MKQEQVKAHFTNKPFKEETVKVSKDSLHVYINTITGKDGDFWVCISPSLNVSGYGDTKKDAQESFELNIKLYLNIVSKLSLGKKITEFKKLGWSQGKLFKRRLSKAFVDSDGILNDLEHAELNSHEKMVA